MSFLTPAEWTPVKRQEKRDEEYV